MAAPVLNHAAPCELRRLFPLSPRRRSFVEMLYTTHEPVHLANFSFDAGSLLDLSTARELDRLCRSPDLSAKRLQRQSSVAQSYLSSMTTRGQHDPSHRRCQSTPGITSSTRRLGSAVSGSSLTRTSSRRLVRSSSTSGRERWLQDRQAAILHLAATLSEPLKDLSLSRRRRKEEFINNGLEPVPNLVGLGGCVLRRPQFTYRPLSTRCAGTRLFPADPDTHTQLRRDVGGRTFTQGATFLPRSSSSRARELSLSSVAGNLALSPGSFPTRASRTHAANTSGDLHSCFRADASILAAVRSRGVNSALPSPASSVEVRGCVEESLGTDSSDSTLPDEIEDAYFDEDPLATQLVQRSGSVRWTAQAESAATGLAPRRQGKNNPKSEVGSRTTQKVVSSVSSNRLSSPRRHVPLPRASVIRSNSSASWNSSAIDRASSLCGRESVSLASTKPALMRILRSLAQSPTQQHSYRVVQKLLEQTLRVRLRYERVIRKGLCPCGVCDDLFRQPWLRGRGRGSATGRKYAAFLSSGPVTYYPHNHRSHILPNDPGERLYGFRGGPQPPSHVISSSRDVHEREHDSSGGTLREYYRPHRPNDFLPRHRIAPIPPSMPQCPSSSPPDRGRRRRRPSSVASLSQLSGQLTPHTLEVTAATRRAPSRGRRYYDGEAADERSLVLFDEGRDGSGREVRDDAASQSGVHQDSKGYDHVIEVLRCALKNASEDNTGADHPATHCAPSGVTAGSLSLLIEALLDGLHRQGLMDDTMHAELLRKLREMGENAVPTPVDKQMIRTAETGDTTIPFLSKVPHPPLSPPSPQAPERRDAAVEMGTLLFSSLRSSGKSNPSCRRKSSMTLDLGKDTPPLTHATSSGKSHSGQRSPRSSPSLSVSSVDLKQSLSGSTLDWRCWVPREANTQPSSAPATDVHLTPPTMPTGVKDNLNGFLHGSVMRGQLCILLDLHDFLRERLQVDEQDTRWEICRRRLKEGEAVWRQSLESDRAMLVMFAGWQFHYLQHRIYFAEAALKGWAATLQETRGRLGNGEVPSLSVITKGAAAIERLTNWIDDFFLQDKHYHEMLKTCPFVFHKLVAVVGIYTASYAQSDIGIAERGIPVVSTGEIKRYDLGPIIQAKDTASVCEAENTEGHEGRDLLTERSLPSKQFSPFPESTPVTDTSIGYAPTSVTSSPLDASYSAERSLIDGASPPPEAESRAHQQVPSEGDTLSVCSPPRSGHEVVNFTSPLKAEFSCTNRHTSFWGAAADENLVREEPRDLDTESQQQSISGNGSSALTLSKTVNCVPESQQQEQGESPTTSSSAFVADVASLPMGKAPPPPDVARANLSFAEKPKCVALPRLSVSTLSTLNALQSTSQSQTGNELSSVLVRCDGPRVEKGSELLPDNTATGRLLCGAQGVSTNASFDGIVSTDSLGDSRDTGPTVLVLDSTQVPDALGERSSSLSSSQECPSLVHSVGDIGGERVEPLQCTPEVESQSFGTQSFESPQDCAAEPLYETTTNIFTHESSYTPGILTSSTLLAPKKRRVRPLDHHDRTIVIAVELDEVGELPDDEVSVELSPSTDVVFTTSATSAPDVGASLYTCTTDELNPEVSHSCVSALVPQLPGEDAPRTYAGRIKGLQTVNP